MQTSRRRTRIKPGESRNLRLSLPARTDSDLDVHTRIKLPLFLCVFFGKKFSIPLHLFLLLFSDTIV